MGTWGAKSFENDDASNWIYELESATDLSLVQAALRAATGQEVYLEAPEAAVAVAAAEVVAALKGAPGEDLPDEVRDWARGHASLYSADLARQAVQALERVTTASELRELWEEGTDPAEWREVIRQLRSRLSP